MDKDTKITWDQVIDRANKRRFNDLVVGYAHWHCRGPVKRVYRSHNRIIFETIWFARKDASCRGWEKVDEPVFSVSAEVQPELENGTVEFLVDNTCLVHLLSKAAVGSSLDPRKVAGLEPDQIRNHRAWQYNLAIGASWPEILDEVRDQALDGSVSDNDQRQIQEEAAKSGTSDLNRFMGLLSQ
jgi:hypothetical protein